MMDDPRIRDAERNGVPDGFPEWQACPDCGHMTGTLYVEHGTVEVLGCDVCIGMAELAADKCPVCGEEDTERICFDFRHRNKPGRHRSMVVGCEKCVEEISVRDWWQRRKERGDLEVEE